MNERGHRCRGIVHLWALEIPGGEETSVASLTSAEELGCLSLLHVVQGVVECGWPVSPRLYVVMRGVHDVHGSKVASPAESTVWGLARVVMNEQPDLRCTLIDLCPAGSAEEPDSLFLEFCADSRDDEVALRGPARFVHRLAPTSMAELRDTAQAVRPARSQGRGGATGLPIRDPRAGGPRAAFGSGPCPARHPLRGTWSWRSTPPA